MILKYTPEQLEERYQKLPEELKDALFSVETTKLIDRIRKENKFSEKDAEKLAELVGRVLIGILPPKEFEESLKAELGIPAKSAKKIAETINSQVFDPVKESLTKLYKPTGKF